MSRMLEGYEALPGGVEEPPPHLQQQAAPQQHAPPQQAARAPPPASQGPVLGVPVPPQFAGAAPPGALPPEHLEHLVRLPTAAEEWDAAAVVMSVWLGCSVATLALSVLTANTFAITGSLCAVVGAATHRFPRCRGEGGFAASLNRVHTLAIVAASLCGVVAVLSTLIAFGLSASCKHAGEHEHGGTPDPKEEQACAEITTITLMYALWYTFFTSLCTVVSRRTRRMRMLLNPVTSGLVTI